MAQLNHQRLQNSRAGLHAVGEAPRAGGRGNFVVDVDGISFGRCPPELTVSLERGALEERSLSGGLQAQERFGVQIIEGIFADFVHGCRETFAESGGIGCAKPQPSRAFRRTCECRILQFELGPGDFVARIGKAVELLAGLFDACPIREEAAALLDLLASVKKNASCLPDARGTAQIIFFRVELR